MTPKKSLNSRTTLVPLRLWGASRCFTRHFLRHKPLNFQQPYFSETTIFIEFSLPRSFLFSVYLLQLCAAPPRPVSKRQTHLTLNLKKRIPLFSALFLRTPLLQDKTKQKNNTKKNKNENSQ